MKHLLLLALALLLSCRQQPQEELVIVSPHSPEIRVEFSRAFSAYHKARTGRDVLVKWLDVGGTGEAIQYIRSRNAEKRQAGGVDLFFGGGDFPFVQLKKQGLLAPHGVPDSILRNIPRYLGGVELFPADSTWYGAALSSFGIAYNRAALAQNNLPLPATWEDLAEPACRGWVSSGDPRYSGSMHTMYEILLQAYGWQKGWDIICRMGANVQTFEQGASMSVKAVSLGQAAYGLAIDFYALTEIQRYGNARLGFCLPEGLSAINADGIAVLKGAPNAALAGEFVDFVLSEGQKLWAFKPGQPGGPHQYALCRFPIDSTVYTLDPASLSIEHNPYSLASTLKYDGRTAGKRWAILGDLVAAYVITPHRELKRCWSEVIRKGLTPQQYGPLFAPELAEAEALELSAKWGDKAFAQQRIELMNRWTAQAKKRYGAVYQDEK
jgi:ABC-type Fe3+ transport system substrate-binding protein